MANPSKLVICPICGKQVRARGLYGHMKLKDHVGFSNLTRVDDNNLIDSSYDSSKIEKKATGVTQKSQLTKLDLEKLSETEGNNYTGLKGLEAEARQFKPRFSHYLNHYTNNPDLALKHWEQIIELEKKYSWPILINPEKYRALQRLFG